MKLRVRPRTFRLFERLADGPRGYVAPVECEDCGTRDENEHSRWCQHFRGAAIGAHHVGKVNESLPGDAAALSDEPDAAAPSRARRMRTSRSSAVRRDPAQVGRAPR
jgi:hypothetical protein